MTAFVFFVAVLFVRTCFLVAVTGGGPDVVLGYKKTAAGCDANGGWYYDVDPVGGATPTKIELCPTSCEGVKGGTVTAKLNILLGCQSIVK